MAQRTAVQGRTLGKKAKRRQDARDRFLIDVFYKCPSNLIGILRFVALHAGFPSDRTRKRAWGVLLNAEDRSCTPTELKGVIIPHADTDQIERDVQRSLYIVPTARGERHKKRVALSRVMNAVISSDPTLRYYQGYHDIATIFLLVCGEKSAFHLVDTLSHTHIRACLHPDLAPVVEILGLLLPLIEYVDEEVHQFIQDAGVQPYFALSWVLTWFAHDFDRADRLRRLFDFFIVCHPMMPLYFAAVSVCHMTVRRRLLQMEREYSSVHTFLMNLFSSKTAIFTADVFPFESLIYECRCLFTEVSPDALFELAGKKDVSSPYRVTPFPWMNSSVFPSCAHRALTLFVTLPIHVSYARVQYRRSRQLEFGNTWGELPGGMDVLPVENGGLLPSLWAPMLVVAVCVAIFGMWFRMGFVT